LTLDELKALMDREETHKEEGRASSFACLSLGYVVSYLQMAQDYAASVQQTLAIQPVVDEIGAMIHRAHRGSCEALLMQVVVLIDSIFERCRAQGPEPSASSWSRKGNDGH
jgi:hypothetical protein